jgi:hypothetical protein
MIFVGVGFFAFVRPCTTANLEAPAFRKAAGAFFQSRSSVSTQASLRSHLCIFRHAGQRNGTAIPSSIDSSRIVLVVRPVGTSRCVIGQRVIMWGIVVAITFCTQ